MKTIGDIAQTFYDTITAAGYKAAMYANTDCSRHILQTHDLPSGTNG